MGTRLARTVADHALHVRLLVLHDAFLWKARGRRLGTPRRYALVRCAALVVGVSQWAGEHREYLSPPKRSEA